MGRLVIGWPLANAGLTLTGGDFDAGAPVTNLLTPVMGHVARTVDASEAKTVINATTGSGLSVGVVALKRHNMRSAATWRIRGSENADMSSAEYDSGFIDVFDEQWDTGVLPAGHPNASSRKFTDAQINLLNPKFDAVHVLTTETNSLYWRINLKDTGNVDGYIEAGYLAIGPLYSPTFNISPGAEFVFDDGTVIGSAYSRAKLFLDRPRGRKLTVTWTNLASKEAIGIFTQMQQDVGVGGFIYVVLDPSNAFEIQRTSFLARLSNLTPVQFGAVDRATISVTFEEAL